MNQTESLLLIDEICKEKNIDINYLSLGWIRELKKDGKICHIVRNSFDLNPASAYNILNDKYATYEVLKNNGVNTLEHYIIFNPCIEKRKEFIKNIEKEVDEIYTKIGKKEVVVKANSSSEGKEVYKVNSKREILVIINDIFSRNFESISICPFENIECEYRVIFLDNEILYVYKKIAKDWKHNLSNGASIITNLENDEVLEDVKKLALKAGHATNSRFASIDISKKINGEIFVMEINASVCMSKFIENVENGREIAKNIYTKAINKMFLNS